LIVHRRDAKETLSLSAGDVVVCVLEIPGDPEATADGVANIAARLPEDVPVLALAGSECGETLGGLTRPADVVLMTAWCRPPEGWLARLREAAASDEMIGTASPIGVELIGETGELRPAAVAEAAARSRPRVRGCDPHCVYARREALDLVELPGADGDVITNLGDEMAAAGMLNVLADDLLVPVAGPDGSRRPSVEASFDEGSPVQQAVRLARITQRALSLTVDGRALNRVGGGTQRYVLELVLALDRVGAGRVSLRVVLPPDPPAAVLAELASRPRIETIRYEQALGGVARTDVVHRPQQVFSVDDLNLVRLLGDRLVITHQDLIGYHNAAYHARPEYWERYRQATRLALAAADRTIFFSEAARHDAFAESLVGVERTEVIGIALDEPFPEPPSAPAGMSASDEFIVCLGADYRHKNRPFALRLADVLRRNHGFQGRLVLAGAHVEHGSSAVAERTLLGSHPDLAESVIDLGAVAEPERAWLLQNARAVVVPSVVEGFGLMPLEAAAAGVPCLFPARSSLREVVSEDLATLVCWDPVASARAGAELLLDGSARDAHVRRLRGDAARWNWDALAPRLLEAYERTVRAPVAPATGLVWRTIDDELAMAGERAVHQELLDHLRGRAALARDDGFFTEEELRGLWRAGSRPAVKRALLAPVRLIGRPPGRG
jgi:glycosyltransferase involved in cell wall biosynthesis